MTLQYQNLHDILVHLNSCGTKHFVVCPGSRNAPIINLLSSIKGCILYNHIDERSAAYFALGIAKKVHQPVAVVCTSGTAALNLAPAMAEAYYQNICLVAITADRPKGSENSFEAQSINQQKIFNNFVAAQLDIELNQKWELPFKRNISRKTKEALERSLPIHVNLRLSEPLYDFDYETPTEKQSGIFSKESWINFSNKHKKDSLSNKVLAKLKSAKRPLVFLGFDVCKDPINSETYDFPILADACSPNYLSGNIFCFDFFMNDKANNTALSPDVLITTGTYMLSKNLRNWLKANPPLYHLHIGSQTNYISPFTSDFEIINCHLNEVLEVLGKRQHSSFNSSWQNLERSSKQSLILKSENLKSEFNRVLATLLNKSENSILHCGNSMSVRYGSLFQSIYAKFTYLIANRGTSGIDGCLSTFLGYALNSSKREWLVIGDISFFYDCNAFWIKPIPLNFVIVVINNQGGQIFDIIHGPEKMSDAKKFITTPHLKSVMHIAQMHNIKYNSIQKQEQINDIDFNTEQGQIIEIFDINPQTVVDFRNLFP